VTSAAEEGMCFVLYKLMTETTQSTVPRNVVSSGSVSEVVQLQGSGQKEETV